MKKNKKNIIISVITVVLLSTLVTIGVMSKNKYEEITLDEINEDHYDISYNVKDKVATIDGKKYKITDIDGELTSEADIYNYLKNNAIGDSNKDGDNVQIINPYSTDTLIVRTEDKKVFNKYDEIVSVEEISDNLYSVTYKNAKDTKKAYSQLKDDDKIINVVTDAIVKVADINSSYYAWGVASTALSNYKDKLNTENNGNNITVAVLDTGIRSTHEVFRNTSAGTYNRLTFENSYDYVNDDENPSDDNGHGTEVSGIISESTSNNVKILPVKVLGSSGSGSLSNIVSAINDIKDDVDIINLSLGVEESKLSSSTRTEIEKTFKSIYQNTDTIVVCAAGNESAAVDYPASSDYTLAISSVNKNNSFSSSFSNYGKQIDFAAPGEDLILPCFKSDYCYMYDSGTSFSSPFTAASLAMIKSENPTLNRDEIINSLKESSIDLGSSGKDKYYGYGSINFHVSMFPFAELSNGKKVYYNKDGSFYKGFKEIDGKIYFFSYANGQTKTGWQSIDGVNWFYCNNDGTIKINELATIEKNIYYFDQNGYRYSGFKKITDESGEEKLYFFSYANGQTKTGWQSIDGVNWFYCNSDGTVAVGLKQIGNAKYYFDARGYRYSGFKKITDESGEEKFYFFSYVTGQTKTGWQSIDGINWFYCNSDGTVAVGLKQIGNAKYYFDARGYRYSGFKKITDESGEEKFYFFSYANGQTKIGWQSIDGVNWFYCNSDGTLAIGLTEINGAKYYFDERGYRYSGFKTITDENGVEKTYFFSYATGQTKTGWQSIDGINWFYCNSDGTVSQ